MKVCVHGGSGIPTCNIFAAKNTFSTAFRWNVSGMTHFRRRIGEKALEALLQETLAAAYRAGALNLKATEAVAVDTTVPEKAIGHPTEHGLLRASFYEPFSPLLPSDLAPPKNLDTLVRPARLVAAPKSFLNGGLPLALTQEGRPAVFLGRDTPIPSTLALAQLRMN
jgi:hypothetical protein